MFAVKMEKKKKKRKKAVAISRHMATDAASGRCTESHPAVELQWGCWLA